MIIAVSTFKYLVLLLWFRKSFYKHYLSQFKWSLVTNEKWMTNDSETGLKPLQLTWNYWGHQVAFQDGLSEEDIRTGDILNTLQICPMLFLWVKFAPNFIPWALTIYLKPKFTKRLPVHGNRKWNCAIHFEVQVLQMRFLLLYMPLYSILLFIYFTYKSIVDNVDQQ